MLTAYALHEKQMVSLPRDQIESRLGDIVWIDLNQPTPEEEKYIENLCRVDIPTQEEMAALELSNRLYEENGAYFFTVTIVTHVDTEEPSNKPYTFVLNQQRLITVRYAQTQPFKIVTDRILKRRDFVAIDPKLIALGLFEAMVNRLADVLEKNDRTIDAISKSIFRSSNGDPEGKTPKNEVNLFGAIRATGIEGDVISKVKESLVSLSRLVSYIKQIEFFPHESDENQRVRTLALDISALNDHAGFLSNKITFLLDATLGMIGIEQNAIIKIFSIAAVIFLPPTLVASIYGMNFKHMPELEWYYGYPMAIVMMVLAGYLPYRFFQYKKWL
ncbi:MAG: Magnesium transporter [Alphaproteobacteria bacterium]|nr:Magnesium transporter [Alphaproteobacteria bacterium]